MLKKYNQVVKEIREIPNSLSSKILYAIFSLVLSALIVSGPICILINLMIFRNFQKLLAFGIATFLILFVLILDFIYIKCATKGEVKNTKVVVLTDTFIIAIAVYLLLIFLYVMGVI